jgi:hypothetical protein
MGTVGWLKMYDLIWVGNTLLPRGLVYAAMAIVVGFTAVFVFTLVAYAVKRESNKLFILLLVIVAVSIIAASFLGVWF